MNLRKLRIEDAPLMLEWMHDDTIVREMKTNFASKTLEDCISFINVAQDTKDSLHLAIVDDNDMYMGTVSLKHITKTSAEFGIAVRKCAMGKGYSKYAIQSIIETGFKQFELKTIYWCVAPENRRAVNFYEKNKFVRCLAPEEANYYYTDEEITHFIWYAVTQ